MIMARQLEVCIFSNAFPLCADFIEKYFVMYNNYTKIASFS